MILFVKYGSWRIQRVKLTDAVSLNPLLNRSLTSLTMKFTSKVPPISFTFLMFILNKNDDEVTERKRHLLNLLVNDDSTTNIYEHDTLCVIGGKGTFHELINGLRMHAKSTHLKHIPLPHPPPQTPSSQTLAWIQTGSTPTCSIYHSLLSLLKGTPRPLPTALVTTFSG